MAFVDFDEFPPPQVHEGLLHIWSSVIVERERVHVLDTPWLCLAACIALEIRSIISDCFLVQMNRFYVKVNTCLVL